MLKLGVNAPCSHNIKIITVQQSMHLTVRYYMEIQEAISLRGKEKLCCLLSSGLIKVTFIIEIEKNTAQRWMHFGLLCQISVTDTQREEKIEESHSFVGPIKAESISIEGIE